MAQTRANYQSVLQHRIITSDESVRINVQDCNSTRLLHFLRLLKSKRMLQRLSHRHDRNRKQGILVINHITTSSLQRQPASLTTYSKALEKFREEGIGLIIIHRVSAVYDEVLQRFLEINVLVDAFSEVMREELVVRMWFTRYTLDCVDYGYQWNGEEVAGSR